MLALKADVADDSDVAGLFSSAEKTLGGLDSAMKELNK